MMKQDHGTFVDTCGDTVRHCRQKLVSCSLVLASDQLDDPDSYKLDLNLDLHYP